MTSSFISKIMRNVYCSSPERQKQILTFLTSHYCGKYYSSHFIPRSANPHQNSRLCGRLRPNQVSTNPNGTSQVCNVPPAYLRIRHETISSAETAPISASRLQPFLNTLSAFISHTLPHKRDVAVQALEATLPRPECRKAVWANPTLISGSVRIFPGGSILRLSDSCHFRK